MTGRIALSSYILDIGGQLRNYAPRPNTSTGTGNDEVEAGASEAVAGTWVRVGVCMRMSEVQQWLIRNGGSGPSQCQ